MGVMRRVKFSTVALLLEVFFVLMFAFTAEYDPAAGPKAAPDPMPVVGYPAFQDVHVMIFIGFGFLMTFLRRYGCSAVGINMLLAALVIQWAMIVRGCIYEKVFKGEKFVINVGSMVTADFAAATVLISFGAMLGKTSPLQLLYNSLMVTADFAAATVLISFGAVLGKTSPLQLLIMAMIETVIAQINGWLCHDKLHAVDIGESMYIHAFGAYFGLAVTFVLQNRNANDHPKAEADRRTDLFSFIGTIFLWMFWPSFNGGGAVGDEQHRAFINTYLSLCACTIATFIFSGYYDKRGRFAPDFIQNATLAGGVAVGTTANMPLEPFGAMCMGVASGFISVTGFRFLNGFLAKYLRIHDTCGVHNLHGLPGVLAGVGGSIMAARASKEDWGRSYYEIFPAVAPMENSTEYRELMMDSTFAGIEPGDGYSSSKQAVRQILALAVTLGIAIGSGIVTGIIMKIPGLDQVHESNELFEDEPWWHVPEHDEEKYVVGNVKTDTNGSTHGGTEMKSYTEWKRETGPADQSNSNIRL